MQPQVCKAGCILGNEGIAIDRLQTQLDTYGFDGVDFPQEVDHILAQTIGPGADGKTNDVVRSDGLQIQLPQPLHRCVSAAEGLEVGNVLSAFVLGSDACLCLFQLQSDRLTEAFGKFSAAVGRAENATPCIQSAIPVGAGKACVKRDFCNLAAKLRPQRIVVGVIAFVTVCVRKWIDVLLCEFLLLMTRSSNISSSLTPY